jgi:hypothetical protein
MLLMADALLDTKDLMCARVCCAGEGGNLKQRRGNAKNDLLCLVGVRKNWVSKGHGVKNWAIHAVFLGPNHLSKTNRLRLQPPRVCPGRLERNESTKQ